MNLTIFDSYSKLKPRANTPLAPGSSNSSHVHSVRALPPKYNQKPNIQPNCTTSFFGTCVEPKQIQNSDQDEILLKGKMVNNSHLNIALQQKDEARSSGRKQKLSLSRKQSKDSHHMNVTPLKNKVQQGQVKQLSANKFYSEQVKKNGESHSKTQKINIYNVRSEPKKESSQTITSLQMKESIKLSTNMASANANSLKKEDDSAKKPKLTLSNNFKSQMQEPKDSKQDISEFNPNFIINRQSVPKTNSQSVMIEQSFMTARLKNIYGEMSNTQDLYSPSSNIALYNNLTGGQRQMISCVKNHENGSQPEVEKYRSHDNSVNYSNGSIHQDTSIQRNNNQVLIENDQRRDVINDFSGFQPESKEKRWIGSYAKTIKTFNDDNRSEEESVVLEHFKNQGGFMTCLPLNRGSIKDNSGEDALEIYRRRYSSFGEDSGEGLSAYRDRLTRYVNQPIEEDANDEERQS